MPKARINGIQLYYKSTGDSDAAYTVAFFNGAMQSAGSWSKQVSVIRKFNYRILQHDFRGQLMSDKPVGLYSFSQHADDARKLFESLAIRKVHIVGSSYGGEVGIRFALNYPEMVKSLCIIVSASETDEALSGKITRWAEAAEKKDGEKLFDVMLPDLYSANFARENKEFISSSRKSFKTAAADFFRGQESLYRTFLKDNHLTGELSRLKCPVMVIGAELDRLKPFRFAKMIADHIPQAELVKIPDCGHAAVCEKPDEINSIISGFILKNSSPSA